MKKISGNAATAKGINPNHADVVDGLRACAILIIAWYHIWQQSWLSPIIKLDFLRLGSVSLDVIPRTGYLFVDFMLFISAFCLFLPHARAMVTGETPPNFKDFYLKRGIRILPLYVLSVLLFFGYALFTGCYTGAKAAITELVADLTFTQMFFSQTYLNAQINGVLWTVCVEMQFYLLFPLLARCFRKKPLFTFIGMVSVGELYLRLYALQNPEQLRMTVNQLPAFFGVFACGMLCAVLYEKAANRLTHSLPLGIGGMALTALSLWALRNLLYKAAASQTVQVFQGQYRIVLAVVFLVLTLGLSFSPGFIRFLFSNPLIKWVAGISYPLYICHQWIAVRLKQWHIPYWEGDTLPNMAGNTVWQHRYTLLCFVLAVAVAALFTYAVDKPITKRLRRDIKG